MRPRKDDTQEFPSPLEPVTRAERRWGVFLAVVLLIIAHVMWEPEDAGAASPAPRGVTVQGTRADSHQREMIGRVLAKCDQMRAPRKVLIASIATTTVESWSRNLRYGHSSSLGLFQILNIHGTEAQRTNPEWSAKWFCSRAININYHVPNLTVAQLSQRVQRSAHPDRYRMWTREAVRTYRLTMHRP